MVDESRQSDIVNKAFETLRTSHLPEGPSSQALGQTLQAVYQAQQKSSRISLVERIKNMNKFIKYPIAAAIAFAVFAGGAYLFLGRSAGVAFADVREQIEQAQTMTATVKTTAEMKVMDKPTAMTMNMKMYSKSPGLMRQEVEIPTPPNAAPQPGATQPATAPESQKIINIIDMNNQKGITLFPEKKQAITMEFKNVPAKEMTKMKRQNFLEKLKEAIAGEHKELGEKKIGSQLAKGYRCKVPEMPQVAMDIWMDAATGKPLLVEQTMPEEMGFGKVKVTMTDIVLNPKLEDSLFDTNVPQGYSTLMNESVDHTNAKEEDMIKWLRTQAEGHGGVFAKSLFDPPQKATKNATHPASQKSPTSQEETTAVKEAMAKMQPMQKALVFQMRMMQGGEFVYAGEGVKLGDKTAPILWYKAKDAKTYRVIYGDLHAEDAATAPKSPGSQPATQPK